IADAADALTEPHLHLEPVYDVDGHRNRRMRRVYRATQPGLLQALWVAIEPGRAPPDEGRGAAGYRPVPPLCLEALSRYAAIQVGVLRLCWPLRGALDDTTASGIREQGGAAAP